MALVSDILVTPRSGLIHIDALLDKGPDWNYLTGTAANTIYYTFSITSGNEKDTSGQEAFTQSQQIATRTAFGYIQGLTGIQFVETAVGTNAQIHLANLNIKESNVTGLASWGVSYSSNGTTLVDYKPQAYIYLDNVEYRTENRDLTPGGSGYQTLLHEIGHALGLKHPFEEAEDGGYVLPKSQDVLVNTIMSYDHSSGPYSTFSPYDIAALNWLYGGDGLGGALGINSSSGARYLTGISGGETLTGTAYDDTIQGNGGNDMIDGGAGTDTVVFSGSRSAYTLSNQADGTLAVTHALEGTATLRSVEILRFADMNVIRANVSDTTAPKAPTMSVMQNAKLYARGDKPLMTGSAEANSTVRVYVDNVLVATTKAGAEGLWSVVSTLKLPDRMNYQAHATATDESGNTSQASALLTFHIDATPPPTPTLQASMASGSNQPVFAGTGEAGNVIELYRAGETFIKIGEASVGTDGRWQFASKPLPDGGYTVIAAALDVAGNATSSANTVALAIANPANKLGSAQADTFVMGPENAAISGGGGIDVAVFAGKHTDYTISQEAYGWAVRDRNGVDALYDVERLQFADTWFATDEPSIQLFRLYRAALGREAEPFGLGYWMDRVDKGTSMLQIAHEFTWAPEFKEKYGDKPTDEVFITKLYANVLNRTPDADGFAYWLTRVDDSSREQIMLEFSESVENKAQVLAQTSDGIEFTPYKQPTGLATLIGVEAWAEPPIA